jgi:uncharacterized membrane protein
VALNLYAAGLVVARSLVYRARLYRPMLLNIGLSIAPILILALALGLWLLLTVEVGRWAGFAALAPLGVLWLLMLPNASYLITELNLSHRREDDAVPIWYDVILVITLAMSGVTNTVLNVFVAHTTYALAVHGDHARGFISADALVAVGAVLLLLGLGMYLGRYLRLNSWDVRHPAAFARKAVGHFRVGGNAWACLGFSLTYAVFLAVMYAIMVGPIIGGMITRESLFA